MDFDLINAAEVQQDPEQQQGGVSTDDYLAGMMTAEQPATTAVVAAEDDDDDEEDAQQDPSVVPPTEERKEKPAVVQDREITFFIAYKDGSGVNQKQSITMHQESTLGYLKEEIYVRLKVAPEYQVLSIDRFPALQSESNKKELSEFEIVDNTIISLSRNDGKVIQGPSLSAATAGGSGAGVMSSAANSGGQGSRPKTATAPKSIAPKRAGLSEQEIKLRRLWLRAEQKFNTEERAQRDFLVRWSLYLCRAMFVFLQLCVLLFFAFWGYWGMIYYLLGILFSVVGWFGVRRLSTKFIYFFCFFLFMDIILMFDSLVTSARKKESHGYGSYGTFVFFLVLEMICILSFMAILVWFGWRIHQIKQVRKIIVDVASMHCQAQVILV